MEFVVNAHCFYKLHQNFEWNLNVNLVILSHLRWHMFVLRLYEKKHKKTFYHIWYFILFRWRKSNVNFQFGNVVLKIYYSWRRLYPLTKNKFPKHVFFFTPTIKSFKKCRAFYIYRFIVLLFWFSTSMFSANRYTCMCSYIHCLLCPFTVFVLNQ